MNRPYLRLTCWLPDVKIYYEAVLRVAICGKEGGNGLNKLILKQTSETIQ